MAEFDRSLFPQSGSDEDFWSTRVDCLSATIAPHVARLHSSVLDEVGPVVGPAGYSGSFILSRLSYREAP